MSLPRLYSASGAADYLGISPTSFRALNHAPKRYHVATMGCAADCKQEEGND